MILGKACERRNCKVPHILRMMKSTGIKMSFFSILWMMQIRFSEDRESLVFC